MAEAKPKSVNPTLLVGVGGTGCEIADRVYAMAVRARLTNGCRLQIIGFDTDENDLKLHRHLGYQQRIRTSTNHTVRQILRFHPDIQDSQHGWFAEDHDLSTEIRQLGLMKGAGQIRMMSRLAFQTAMEDVHTVAKLQNVLNALMAHDGRTIFEGQVNVVVVGSLAGGTGAGMFLQVALLLAALLREQGINPELRGLFLLPDIFVRAAQLPADQVNNVRANGYAALRELNAVMRAAAGHHPIPVEFEYVRGRRLQTDGLPFKSVVLLDYEDQFGSPLGNNFAAYKDLAARAAYNLLFTQLGRRYESIAINDIRARLAGGAVQQQVAEAGRGAMNYYSGVGVAEAAYPEDDILDYLALRYSQSLLAGNWLLLDQMYQQEVAQYHQQLQNGVYNLKPPVRGDSFCRDLMQLATQQNIRFFRELYDQVHIRQVNNVGTVLIKDQYRIYLDALEKHVKDSFWGSEAKLKQARHHPGLTSDHLTNRMTLVNDVLTLEYELRSYLQTIERALDEQPYSLFASVVLSADLLGEKEWKDYHLPSYLVRGGPHPVQVRYFLYRLLQTLDERRAQLDEHQHLKAIQQLKESFDDPNTPIVESAQDIADKVSQGILPAWLDLKFKRFTNDYREYFNTSLYQLRNFAEDTLLRRVYERVEQYVKELLAVLENFFNDLGDLENDLLLECNQAEVRHQEGAGIAFGIRYVLASRDAKRALWADLKDRFGANLANQQAEANAAITHALYQQHRDRQTATRWQDVRPLNSKALFRQKILQEFCRRDITDQHSGVYQLNLIEAVRREALLNGQDFKELLSQIKDLIARQAEPSLALANPQAGQTIRLWMVSAELKKALGDEELYSRLFSSTAGESPVEIEPFSNDRMVCVNTRVNLTLQDLSKLHYGSGPNANVGDPAMGSYYRAYRAMLDRIIADKQANPDALPRDFTPHLDRRWDKPGMLPEIFPELENAVQAELMDGYVLGIALGLLTWETREGERVALYHDWEQLGTPQAERILCRGFDDDLALLDVLRVNPHVPAGIIQRAQAIREQRLGADHQPAADAKQTLLYQGLLRPQTLERILRISTNRDPKVKADETTAEAIQALFRQFKGCVQATLPELPSHRQRRLVEDELEAQKNTALDTLRTGPEPLYEETLKVVTGLVEGQLDRLYH